MVVAVAESGPERAGNSPADERRGNGDRKKRQPGRNQVKQIVNAGGNPAEEKVAFVAVAPAGVEGVGAPQQNRRRRRAGETAREKTDGEKEERAVDGVDQIFAEALDCAADDFGGGKRCGVPADDHRKRVARGRKVVSAQRFADCLSVFEKTARRDGDVEQNRRNGGRELSGEAGDRPRGGGNRQNEQEPARQAGENAVAEGFATECFNASCGAPEERDRVEPGMGIPQQEIQHQRNAEGDEKSDHRASSFMK